VYYGDSVSDVEKRSKHPGYSLLQVTSPRFRPRTWTFISL